MGSQVRATEYWVDGTAGDDGNNGIDAPWETITYACGRNLQPGDIVTVKDGVYHDTIIPPNSGTANPLARITFRAENRHKAILDGSSSIEHAVDMHDDVGGTIYIRSHIRIEGFEIRHYASHAILLQGETDTPTATGFEIVDNYIHHCGDYVMWSGLAPYTSSRGIMASNVTHTLIEGNEITYVDNAAISLGGSNVHHAQDITIRNNKIHHVGQDAIKGGGEDLLIEFNHLYAGCLTPNHQDAVEMAYCDNITVRYNVIGDWTEQVTGGVNEDTYDFHDLYVYGNVFYNSLYWKMYGGTCPAVFIDNEGAGLGSQVYNVEIHSNTFLFLGLKPIAIYARSSDTVPTLYHVRVCNNIFYACRGVDSGRDMYEWTGYDIRDIRCDWNCYYHCGYGNTIDPLYPPPDPRMYQTEAGSSGRAIDGTQIYCDSHSWTTDSADPLLESYTEASDFFNARITPGYWNDARLLNEKSDLIGSDMGITIPNPFEDIDHHIRPENGPFLMGAYYPMRDPAESA